MSNKKTKSTKPVADNATMTRINNLVHETAPRVQELKYGEGDNELVVKVYPVLPFTKRMEMVREIVDGVFMDNKDTINTYVPAFLPMVQKFTTLKYFTDVAMPRKLDDLWLFLNYTPIFADVTKIVGEDLLAIFDDANKSIDTYRQYLANKSDINSLFKRVSDSLKSFESKISQDDINSIMTALKGLSGGSSPEDIAKIILGVKDKV